MREFRFTTAPGDVLTGEQRDFLDALAETVRRLRPGELDVAGVETSVDKDGRLSVLLPHRHDSEQTIVATVSADEAVVAYGCEHEHFWPDDPAAGRVWPVGGAGHVAAAGRFVEQVLRGRIELEVRRGFVVLKTWSYWIDDDGRREVFLRGGTLQPSWRRRPGRVVRFDFGVPPER